jgi:hypothetical protein
VPLKPLEVQHGFEGNVYIELAQGKMAGFFGLSKYGMKLPVTSSATWPMHISIYYKGIEIEGGTQTEGV